MKTRIIILSLFCGFAIIMSGCFTENSTHTTKNTIIEIKNSSSSKQYNGPKFDINAIITQMNDCEFKFGTSSDAGIWVVTKIQFSADDEIPERELATRATLLAKQSITEWMNTEASASTEISNSMTNKNGETDVQENFKSEIKSNAKALLRGVTMHTHKKTPKGYTAYFYTTGKNADRSAELEAQLKAAPPGVVRAVGIGFITNGKLNVAKREATYAALRDAVEQVMGTTVVGQSQLMDNDKAKSRVISQTMGNVKQYRVVKEFKDGNNYQIIINAKVEEKHLLENYAAMVRSMGNPGFMVLCKDPDLKAAFSGFLINLGFKVVNKKSEASFIIDGNCKYITATHDYYGKGLQIDLNLRLIDKKTSQEFFNISNEPRFTTTFSGTFHQIRQSCARKAFDKMRDDLHSKLNKVVMDWVLNGRQIKVVFNNFKGDQ